MQGYSVLAMGGYSILVISVVLSGLQEAWVMPLSIFMMFLANFMNHPHFMISYRIFFEIYPYIKNGEFKKIFWLRWWFVAVAVPLMLVILLSIGVIKVLAGDDSIFTIAILLYGASVGWHYVKQGFGMAMSEAALKKCYWSPFTRQWMLWNAYACWIFSMCLLFSVESGVEYFGWKFSIYGGALEKFLMPLGLLFGLTTLGAALMIKRDFSRWRREGLVYDDFPKAGLLGYCVSLYAWVAAGVAFPLLMLVIPFFHSVQYMHVVERLYKSREENKIRRWLMLIFIGFAVFWILPGIFDYINSGRINLFYQRGMLYTAAIWLFVNIHHYFIDNVIWRKENKYIWRRLHDL